MSETPRTDEMLDAIEQATDRAIVEISLLERENAALRDSLETESMRLAACGVAALGYFTDCPPEYRSASLEDVLRLQSALAAEREKVATLEKLLNDHNVECDRLCDENCLRDSRNCCEPNCPRDWKIDAALAAKEAQ